MPTTDRPTDDEVAAYKRGRAAIEHLNKDLNFSWWLDYAHAIVAVRTEAMREAYTNKPIGKAYNQSYARIMKREKLEAFDANARKDCVAMIDNLHHPVETFRGIGILAWRSEKLNGTERARLNHPTAVLRRWKDATKAVPPGERKETVETALVRHVASLKESHRQQLFQQEDEVDTLQSRNAELETVDADGEPVDLVADLRAEIAQLKARVAELEAELAALQAKLVRSADVLPAAKSEPETPKPPVDHWTRTADHVAAMQGTKVKTVTRELNRKTGRFEETAEVEEGNEPVSLDNLRDEIRALLKPNVWRVTAEGAPVRAALGKLFTEAKDLIRAENKTKVKFDRAWGKFVTACEKQPGYAVSLASDVIRTFVREGKR